MLDVLLNLTAEQIMSLSAESSSRDRGYHETTRAALIGLLRQTLRQVVRVELGEEWTEEALARGISEVASLMKVSSERTARSVSFVDAAREWCRTSQPRP
ncbi:MAG TPA: hypothetical protein VM537_09725 [Anaerolineae bacterium]|nr:hypothetical protein [Anaerolineae bacterium]